MSEPETKVQPMAANWRDEVKQLAKLPPIEYDQVREAAIEALGCKASTLDAEVKKARGENDSEDDTKGKGRAFKIEDAEPWDEAVNGADLLDAFSDLFNRYAKLPKHADTKLALWALFTHVYDAFDCCPILRINSPEKECGKSTVKDLMFRLCARPLSVSSVTPAAMFRIIELHRPTLLIDEADASVKDNEDLRAIIDSGHTRGSAGVLRTVEVAGNHEPRMFSTWAPKLVAGIGQLHGTIESRSIGITLQRKLESEKVERLRSRTDVGGYNRKATRWAADNLEALKLVRQDLPEAIGNRAADNWEPLLTVAEIAGGEWPQRALDAALDAAKVASVSSIGTELLLDIRASFAATELDRLSTSDLINQLCVDDSSRWPDFSRGKRISPTDLARLLKPYGIRPKDVRLANQERLKGYTLADFDEAFVRYLPPSTIFAATPRQPNKDGACEDFSSRDMEKLVADEKSLETLIDTGLSRCRGKNTEIGASSINSALETSQQYVHPGTDIFN